MVKGSVWRWLREFGSLLAAAATWGFQVAFAVAGHMLTAPWDRLQGCATICVTFWMILALRDRARGGRQPGGREVPMSSDEYFATLEAITAGVFAALTEGEQDGDGRRLRRVV